MNDLSEFLSGHWLGLLCLALGCALGRRVAYLGMRRRTTDIAAAVFGGGLACLGVGNLIIPGDWGFWLAVAAFGGLFVMVVVLVITSAWSAHLAYALGAVLLAGVG